MAPPSMHIINDVGTVDYDTRSLLLVIEVVPYSNVIISHIVKTSDLNRP